MLVPPEEVDTLVGAILRLAGDAAARSAMGARGREYVVRGWSRQGQAERLLEVLQQSVHHHRSA